MKRRRRILKQQSVKLNQEYYASLGDKKAFVMSYGKNIMILKVVGYAESITDYYKIDDLKAHVWMPISGSHQGRSGIRVVPIFRSFDTALVHNGDFATTAPYASICAASYLSQFLTDTEVSIRY